MSCRLRSPDQRRIQDLIYVIISILYHLTKLLRLLMSKLCEFNIRGSTYLVFHIPHGLPMAGEEQSWAKLLNKHRLCIVISLCYPLLNTFRRKVKHAIYGTTKRNRRIYMYHLCIIVSVGLPLIEMHHDKFSVALIIERLYWHIISPKEEASIIILCLVYRLHREYDRYG